MDNNKDSLNDLDFVLQGYMAYLKLIYDKEIDPQWVKMDMNIKFRIYKDKLISFFPKLYVPFMDSDLRYLSVLWKKPRNICNRMLRNITFMSSSTERQEK